MKKLKEIVDNILNSLKNNKDGYSARKLSGLIVMILVIATHIKWFNSDKWEHYFDIYDHLLGKFYGSKVNYLEI
jgi:hypothetical protein